MLGDKGKKDFNSDDQISNHTKAFRFKSIQPGQLFTVDGKVKISSLAVVRLMTSTAWFSVHCREN